LDEKLNDWLTQQEGKVNRDQAGSKPGRSPYYLTNRKRDKENGKKGGAIREGSPEDGTGEFW